MFAQHEQKKLGQISKQTHTKSGTPEHESLQHKPHSIQLRATDEIYSWLGQESQIQTRELKPGRGPYPKYVILFPLGFCVSSHLNVNKQNSTAWCAESHRVFWTEIIPYLNRSRFIISTSHLTQSNNKTVLWLHYNNWYVIRLTMTFPIITEEASSW
jgi:hypothetical protein